MKLEEQMNQFYDELNDHERSILTQLMSNQAVYSQLSCEQLAAQCHVSRATLLRLCRKIGLVSFSDLKLMLQEHKETQERCAIDLYDTYHALIDELKKFSYRTICEQLYHSETIYVYGTGNEQKTLATECKRIFLTAGKCVVDLFDYGEVEFMKPSFQTHDLFIIISLSGETAEGIKILQSIASTNIPTISITRLQNNTMSHLSKYHMYVATQTIEHRANTYELVSAFYVLMDLLFIHYLNYRKEVEG